MKESPIQTERKTIHLPPDTIQALNKLAARNGTDFSKEVRRAIDEYLDLDKPSAKPSICPRTPFRRSISWRPEMGRTSPKRCGGRLTNIWIWKVPLKIST